MADGILDVAVVGAGISGIGVAAHIARACPEKRIVLLERRARLGGTWDLFRYPGIRSDSDMYTLGFDFAPWRGERAIAAGADIREYLAQVAAAEGLAPHIRCGRTVRAANWDSAAQAWRISIDGPDGPERLAARWLIMGSGYYDYDEPHAADIPGLAGFAGTVVHPQLWPEGLDWQGKRVVVIGSGATAVTIVPAMAREAAHVTMLQRTPSWYLAMPGRDRLARLLQRVLPVRTATRLIRARNRLLQEMFYRRSRRKPATVGAFLKGQLRTALGAAFREEDFTPPYGPWQQRMCLVPDGDLFDALRDGRASVTTGRIARVEAQGVRLEDGQLVPADLIVTATGLKLATLGKVVVSIDGVPVRFSERFWYRDCMLSNVPNFAAVFGYLNAAWTLRVDLVGEWLGRLLRQMDAWEARVATPVLPDGHGLTEDQPFDMFSSGYLQRGKHLIPKSATTAPWRIHMDHRADKAELRASPLDDGWLAFQRALVEPVAAA